MAVWRRRAAELFPELRRNLNSRHYTIYSLFTDLRGILEDAHEASNGEALTAIYGFAEWCLKQKELNNAAAVAFYEHLFQLSQPYWPAIVARLSPQVVQEVWPLWEWLLKPDQFAELQKSLQRSGKPIRSVRGPKALG